MLDDEIAARAVRGQSPSTISHIASTLASIGYELDRSMDCRSFSRWMTGPRAGHSYPCITTGIRETDTKLSFCNVDARRDEKFNTLQNLRRSGNLFAVTRGAILDL
ncbi:MAG: hypothetical protein F8N36_13890 [Desulfovibrio sp.]|nr:hypothetical protein [Desulfovibrio sp.]